MIDAFLHAALLMTTPILLAAIGGLVNRIGGLVNLGLESMMLAGALVAVEVSAATGSAALRRLRAAAGRRRRRARDVARRDAACRPTRSSSASASPSRRRPRALSAEERSMACRAPSIRPASPCCRASTSLSSTAFPCSARIVSGQDALTWLAWALVPVTAFALRRTRWGLRLRATGAAEATVRAVGLAPLTIRDASTVFAGALAGLAGAHLSIGVVGLFNEGITGGRGFIALAAFYFGRDSALAHRARRAAVRRLRRGADPAAGSRRAGRTRADAALCHRHHRADRPRLRRPARLRDRTS